MSGVNKSKKTVAFDVVLDDASKKIKVNYLPGTSSFVGRALFEAAMDNKEMFGAVLSAMISVLANTGDAEGLAGQMLREAHEMRRRAGVEKEDRKQLKN